MFTDEHQRIDVLNEDSESFELLMKLMGKDPAPKHEFIWENIDFSEIKE